MSNQSVSRFSESYAILIAISSGFMFAIVLDSYLLGFALGTGLYFAFSGSSKKRRKRPPH
ncbi:MULTISPECIES: hypothetical protein [unclassified Exiguobacterium]|uniref:hypothetical protein n=1 Tax=unclassified Exiguobacterium TaxID=2644629 RepID=UPI0010401D78|nr:MULTISPECIES: hypothetical protein [unclassified Exiguobacterium]TCI48338.1 hypothetical protein EVJ31_04710 [Exiguobacterium sp. SH5S32]TCI55226.1 hypothetical protein EVJ25_04700 [Exiguobacterium sp. SH1S4]TCI75018.1 hypothetical protein EVJ23_04700 [Exiguobacterium sp. SH1S1]